MTYEVRCECGKVHAVSAADAGGIVRCPCGRSVDVPPLHQLRTAAGEDVLSPAVRIEALLLRGLLPGTRACAVCARETDGLVRVAVACERGRIGPPNSSRDQAVTGCLLGLLIGGLPGLFVANRLMKPNEPEVPKQIGQDVAFTLPLAVCPACRPSLNDSNVLLRALRTVPDYEALLDQYPNAQVTLLD